MHERGRHIPADGVTEVSIGYTNEPQRAELMLAHRRARTTAYERGEWGRVILEVRDVRTTVMNVARAGGKLVRPPGDVESAPVIVAVVEDPDGHQFELVQFK
jgi:predicted enzyme related to lactoylglutathione lyase